MDGLLSRFVKAQECNERCSTEELEQESSADLYWRVQLESGAKQSGSSAERKRMRKQDDRYKRARRDVSSMNEDASQSKQVVVTGSIVATDSWHEGPQASGEKQATPTSSKATVPRPSNNDASSQNDGVYCSICNVSVTKSTLTEHSTHIPHLVSKNALNPPAQLPANIPWDDSNFGYRLLKKQGWKVGFGIGLDGGRALPVATQLKMDRVGLGSKDATKKKIVHSEEDIEEARKRRFGAPVVQIRPESGKSIRMKHAKEREKRIATLQYLNA